MLAGIVMAKSGSEISVTGSEMMFTVPVLALAVTGSLLPSITVAEAGYVPSDIDGTVVKVILLLLKPPRTRLKLSV